MLVNADLHIHSPYSMAVSNAMQPEKLLQACKTKGLQVLGTGDALQRDWQKSWSPFLENSEGVIVVPTTEVEDNRRVHHLILAEDLSQFDDLRDAFSGKAKSFETSGRPHLHLSGEEIAAAVHEAGAFIGPAHAFTPWTALYAYHSRVADCYGSECIDFLELGLSADSSYGAGIADLITVPFLSNSDAHSPQPEKIGREFNTLNLKEKSVRGVLNCIRNGEIVMNAGFFPEEGKYNRTACTRCFEQYSLDSAIEHRWRCPKDGGIIKKGVKDRAKELSSLEKPKDRPPYLHIIPLGQIIQTLEGASSPYTKKCHKIYTQFIETFGNEIAVLTDVPPEEIRSIHPKTGEAIEALRKGNVTLQPGGGGKYGTFSFF